MKIIETFDHMAIQGMCIDHNYYTCGDNASYTNMLRKYDKQNVTIEKLEFLAEDIYHNSNTNDRIIDIMQYLLNEGVVRIIIE